MLIVKLHVNLAMRVFLWLFLFTFMPYSKKKKDLSKNSVKNMAWKLVPGPFVLRIKLSLCWKIKFLKKANYTNCTRAKLSKYIKNVKISMQASSGFFTEHSLKITKLL